MPKLPDTHVVGDLTVDGLIISSSSLDTQIFNSNGTWNKPSSASLVGVRVRSGGQAGRDGEGGGTGVAHGGGHSGKGGANVFRWFFADNVPNSVSVVVGAGGATDAAVGGDSSFGDLMTVPGGGATPITFSEVSSATEEDGGDSVVGDTSSGDPGIDTEYSGPSGGSGGGHTSGGSGLSGAVGGSNNFATGGTAGTAGDPHGGNGGDGGDGDDTYMGAGGGGAGGGDDNGNGGTGGTGGFPGGGGGGGGGGANGGAGGGPFGPGGDGQVIVYTIINASL